MLEAGDQPQQELGGASFRDTLGRLTAPGQQQVRWEMREVGDESAVMVAACRGVEPL